MLTQILTKTPVWVWFLLAGLVALGLTQSVTRVVKLRRVIVMPVIMTSLSLAGALSAFGIQALPAWLTGVVFTVLVMSRLMQPAQARLDPASRKLQVPGSWVPLVLMMGIFLTKYVVGVATAMNPALPHDLVFASALGALYGLFSGVFLGRAYGLLNGAGVWPTMQKPVIA